MTPYLVTDKAEQIPLLKTMDGMPIVPRNNDLVKVEDRKFSVDDVLWDYDRQRVYVRATEIMVIPGTDLKKPHSRACGFRDHEHGLDCNSNCPTCGGKL